jgi:tubulin-specific chaperone E
LTDSALKNSQAAFSQVTELGLEETLLPWDELCRIATNFPALSSLYAGSNQLTMLPSINYLSLATTVTTLDLEYNDFKAISDLGSLAALTALRSLLLKGNYVKQLAATDAEAPTFPPSLNYLDVSYNAIESWSFVDKLPIHFPGLTNLRISHNPVYETQDPDSKTSSTEEAHMFTIARLAALKTLNFSHVTATDRSNAEMFYLSRIAKQLATVPETAEDTVLVQHPRYAELCEIYGEPDIIRREEINPSFLEARLVTVSFHTLDEETRTRRIPRSFDMYAVKGIAGKLFGLSPLKMRLVWETGEWDPVAEFYDREGNSSDEEDNAEGPLEQSNETEQVEEDGQPGRWVKREVELKDGPRQLGYCVDGLDVTIRVERL